MNESYSNFGLLHDTGISSSSLFWSDGLVLSSPKTYNNVWWKNDIRFNLNEI